MRLLRLDLDSPPAGLGRPVATIGNFDGIHLGHRKIIRAAVARAGRAGESALVVTFDPHPVRHLHPGARFCCLKTLDQRLAAIAALGADAAAVLRFDDALARLPPEAFAERVLARMLAVSAVLVGRSFRFGHRRAGDLALLARLGRRLGFEARAVAPLLRGGAPVSSTRVRAALAGGDVREAGRLLGRPFALEGAVVRGKGRGRPLVFPTANLLPGDHCLPAPGVYATRALVRGRRLRGATFVGAPATFGETAPVVETHFPDWEGGELYGETLRLEFAARLRDPARFAGPDELRRQIDLDLRALRRRLRP